MSIRLFPPAPDLRNQIEMCWIVDPHANGHSHVIHRHEVFPSSGMDLVFRFSEGGARMVVLGPRTQRATVELDSSATYMGVRFRTGRALQLADITPQEVLNAKVEIDRIRGVDIGLVAEQLADKKHTAKAEHLENLLRGLTPLMQSESVLNALAQIEAGSGLVRVHDIASMQHVHSRTVERWFREHLAMSPRQCIRLIRFNSLLTLLRSGRMRTLADLAYTCGYADHAHMCKEFKQLTGITPKALTPDYTGRIHSTPKTAILHRYKA